MFNDRLQIALKNKNITGNALCNILKIDNRNYTNWKNNKPPRAETLKQIADILNVSVDWLLEREDAQSPEQAKLIRDYMDSDERGKENICSVADFEAKRSRKAENLIELKPFA